ncbi:helix-turn-helix domain-containing protein [Actinotalea subterranea]|uniref:helix-turn-helix domain-containing protein n=1 Tax=Actinotalea subterranea TaxID=2607497 RepID=UPI0011F0557B|nr:helix-turn-helix transcriptional regulator [Actinotalea subterranea]
MVDEGPRRTDITDEITGYLLAGTSVDLVGMRSSGRSAVLGRVADRLAADGVTVRRVGGIRALRERALSSLAMTGVDVVPSPNALTTLLSAVTELEDLLSPAPAVLLVDDADDLDASTVGAVTAVHARLGTPVLVARRRAARARSATPAVPDLAGALRSTVRVVLPPLRFDEVHRLVHTLLGGPVDPTAVARIAAETGGLPGLVSATVQTARRASHLAPRGGIWVTRGDLWTAALGPAAEAFLSGLDDAEVEALTLVAAAGTLGVDVAQRCIAGETLAALGDAGLLRVVPEGDRDVVGVFPPLLAEHLVRESSPTRRLLVRDRLEAAGHQPGRAPRVPATERASARTRGSEPILSGRLTRYWRDEIAARRAAWDADPTPALAAPLVEALLTARSRPHEIDAVLAATRTPGDDPQAMALFAATRALYEGLVRGRVDEACDRLVEEQRRAPEHAGLLRATEAHLRVLTGALPSADALADGPADQAPLAADALRVARAEVLVAGGQAQAALDLLDGFQSPVTVLQQSADVSRELALLYTCDLEGAVTAALAQVEVSTERLEPSGVQAHAYVAGLGLALQGRLLELDALMSSVLALAPMPAHQSHVQTGLLWLAADAATWQGRTAYARSLALQSGSYGLGRGPHPGMAPDGISAELQDRDSDTADALWALAEERLDRGFVPAGIVAGVTAIERHPDPVRAARLADAAASCDAPLLKHLGAYAVAIASTDPERLSLLEPQLLAAGLRLYAVRTAVARSVRMLTAGDVVQAAAHADAAWHQAGLRGRDLCGLFRPFDRAVSLTAREREIAILVARGMSAPEIAALKVLSVRTVENHIFSACRKVGVNSREGLAHAAQTWLSCAID